MVDILMRLKSLSFSRALLLTTMLCAPSLAMAQDTQPSQPPAEAAQAEDEQPVEEPVAEEPAAEDGEIVVRGRFIPQPMRETSEVATFLSNADLQRAGDDNAASALTRLTGLSIVSERFVFVRGLGDRYSSALLNGSPLPSPEPLRRQVPLDLFPSNILNGAAVQKTFSPNYPGEFGGGIIDLKTLKLPNENFVTLKVGSGWETESTGQEGFVYFGADRDWLGFDDGLRDIPGPLAQAIATRRRIDDANFTPTQLERIGESLVNSPLTVIQNSDRPPDFEGELTGGASIDVGKYNFGLVGVVGYDSSWRTRRAERVEVVGNAVETDFTATTTTNDIVLNAFGSASIGWEENEIALSTLLVRSSTKYTQVEQGLDFNLPGIDAANPQDNERREGTAWYERQIASLQLSGEHEVGPLEIDWRTAFAQSTREAPYERSVRYDIVNGRASFGGGGGLGNSYRFSDLTDEVASTGVDVKYTIPISEKREAVFSGGLFHANTVRNSELYQFSFTGPRGTTPQDVFASRVDFLFSPNNIDPRRFVLNEFTGRDDSYKGRLTNVAGYLAADVEVMPLLRAALGVRYEDATQQVRTFNRFGEASTAPVNLSNEYYLPAATLTWNFAEDLQLRLGYSQTIARPQFRELAFTPFIDPDTDRIYVGNPFLKDSEFENYDARLEYYFGRDRFVTGGAFYKKIQNPIEEVVFRLDRFQTRFINAPEATLYGVELEFRTKFDMPFELPLLADAQWLFATNYTYTKSEVSAGAGTTVISPIDFRARPSAEFGLDGSQLQGTPENIFNLQFGFETDADQLTLLVGWVDERILRRGLGSTQPVLEQPGVNVDLVYRRDFTLGGTDFTLGFSGRNLAGENHEEYQNYARGRNEVNTYDRGRSLSVSLTAKY
jgi:outer membrane receptor protein involved in Fe transport